MTTDQILQVLRSRGITFHVNNGDLVLVGEDETLDPELVDEVRVHKEKLIERGASYKSHITPEMLTLISLTQGEIDRIEREIPGGGSNIQDIYPLAPLQEGILFHHLMAQEGDPYLLSIMLRFDAKERMGIYFEAMQTVVNRHDILRTSFLWKGLSKPVQVVQRSALLSIEEVDFPDTSVDFASQLYSARDPRSHILDVSCGPLLKIYWTYDNQANDYIALILLHHLVGDHTTLELIEEEIEACLRGDVKSLPPALPFRNVVAQALFGVSDKEHNDYFQRVLGDVSEPTLPFGLIDVQGDGRNISEASLLVDRHLSARMRFQARKLGVGTASICHLAWARLLAGVSGRDDVVFGTVLFGRMQGIEGVSRVLGPSINTLPVRVTCSPQGVQRDLQDLHFQLAQLLRHEHASLAAAQRCSAVPPPLPLFSAILNYRYSIEEESSSAWSGVQVVRGEERTNYPFVLSVDDLGVGFRLTAQTVSSISPLRICKFMESVLAGLVTALESTPSLPLHAIPILDASEREQIIYEWNNTQKDYPSDRCVHQLFEEQVLRSPQAPAVSFEEATLSYDELNRKANQLAHYLRAQGVCPDSRVALCLDRGLEMIVALLAVLKSGGAYVPLDPTYPAERIRFMLEDSRPSLLLTQSHWNHLAAGLSVPVLNLDQESALWSAQPDDNPLPETIGLNSKHLAYIIYTSGSTGTPKGVMIEHRHVCNTIFDINQRFSVKESDRTLALSSLSFDLSVYDIFGTMAVGGVVVLSRRTQAADANLWPELVSEQKISVWNSVPPLMQMLVESLKLSQPKTLPSIRLIMLSGDWFPVSLFQQICCFFPNANIHSLGGATEASIWSNTFPLALLPPDYSFVPYGKPLCNQRFYILDGHGEPVPVGVTGELYIGGAGVARGYFDRSELTAERFLQDPFVDEPGARMYRTGDLGRWLPDGNIEFLGRNDAQVKIRGFRIEPGEIEARLRELPAIQDAVVIAREDTPGDKRLVAYYTAAEETVTASELRAHLSTVLPEYMVPAAYIALAALPITANGKLDRKGLPAPDTAAFSTQAYEPPQGETETALAAIWAEILQLDRIGRHDNFFELGGHSLLAVNLIDRLRRSGFYLDVRSLYTAPVLSKLAATLRYEPGLIKPPNNLIAPECDVLTPEMLTLISLTQGEIDRIEREIPGGGSNIQDIYPLAPLQEGILFHHLMAQEGDPYLLSIMLRFDAKERMGIYFEAMQTVVNRHDILRTSFLWKGLSKPVQVVQRSALLSIEEVDFPDTSVDFASQLYSARDPRSHILDVSCGPLLKIYWTYDNQANDYIALILLHHLVGDHTTLELIEEEIEACLRGDVKSLPPALPFRNVVAQALFGVSDKEHNDYFQRVLGDVSEPTLPFGLIDVQGDGRNISEASLLVDRHLSARMRFQARKLGVGTASICHLAWARLLAGVSGRDDVVFGTVLFGRMQGIEGVSRVLGPSINTLPVRVTCSPQGVQRDLQDLHFQLAQLLRHEHASLAAAQRCSAVPPPLPLFSAILNYRYSIEEESSSAWSGVQVVRGEERTNYPFVLSVDDLGVGFRLTAQTVSSISPLRICKFMESVLAGLVTALESTPSLPLHAIPILDASEREQIIYEWNNTQKDYPSDRCVHQLFEEQVLRSPQAPAVSFEEATLSYDELNRKANQLAHYLRAQGVCPDSRVALCLDRGLEMIVALLAVLKSGGAYVPLDPTYPAERIRFMLEDSRPSLLLTQSHWNHLAAGLSVPVLNLDQESALWSAQPDDNPLPETIGLNSKHLAYIIYTSGSTGTPKGVMIEHRGLCNVVLAQSAIFRISPISCTLQVASFSFDASVSEIFTTLCTGARLVIIPISEIIVGGVLEEVIKTIGITHITLSPSVFSQLAYDLPPSLEALVLAGEALRLPFPKPWPQSLQVVNAYGPTETTVCATVFHCDDGATISIGRPIANTRIYILDGHGEPVPVGVTGELYIGGAGVARGYFDRSELTAERFLQDPFVDEPGARMYRTGDLGRWLPDGNIEFLGRNDAQVKIRGFRIEPGEIEARLRELPAIQDAVVIAREDTPGDKRLVAYYTAAEETVTASELRAHLSTVLPEYMVPAAYIALAALPITANGKLDRKGLPAPDTAAFSTRAYEPPQGETETALAAIWAEILQLDRIGRQDNFFELGGHSLLAVRVTTHVRQALSAEIAVRDIFTYPVLVDLAGVMAKAKPAILPAIQQIDRSGPLPVSFAQQRLWFLAQMEGVSQAYHIPAALRLTGRLEKAVLRRALDRIVVRHEVLRTSFCFSGNEPVQRITPAEAASFSLEEHDLQHSKQAETELEQLFASEIMAPFDLEKGPLIRGRLVQLAEHHHVLLLTMHHIVADGWSVGVFSRELRELYTAYLAGEDDPLAALPVQYADYAVWQRQWIKGDILQAQADYWKTALDGIPALLELPTDYPRPAQQCFDGASAELVLDSELTAALKELSRQHGTTLFMTLLSAWSVLLARLSGQNDIVSGTAFVNRNRVEIEGLIGFFVNTLALRLDLAGSPSVSQLLGEAKSRVLAAQQHQDIPFEQVVELLRPVRSTAHSPIFQVMFDWQAGETAALTLPELQVESFGSHRTAKFDLRLFLEESGDVIRGGIEYATALFRPESIQRFLGHFRTLLVAMVREPEQAVDRLPILDASEREQIIYEWNNTQKDYPSDRCVHQLFEEQVLRSPQAPAVSFEEATLSYDELNRKANQLAHYLRAQGVCPDSRVALCLDRGLEMIVALLAVLKSGGAYVPLDPTYPAERIRFMLEDSRPSLLLTQSHWNHLAAGLSVPVLNLDQESALWSAQPDDNPLPETVGLNSKHLAYIIYTSGSTGTPKGVMIEHRGLCNVVLAQSAIFRISPISCTLQVASFSFDASVSEIFTTLCTGARLVIIPISEIIVGGVLEEVIKTIGITHITLSPSVFSQLAYDLPPSLEALVLAGEALRLPFPKPWPQSLQVVNAYGPTETTVCATVFHCDDGATISIGRPIANTRIYILDGHGAPVPVGVTGELYIGGAGVARGYFDRSELTAERFLQDPFVDEPGARMYRTGDLGRWLPDGNIEFLGRNDAQVKIRGFRIEPGEIEARLRELPAIQDAVVIAREDTPGDKRLVAYYTAAEETVTASELRAHLSTVLPEYMVPAAYIALAALPITANGKLDRKGLPAPDTAAFSTQAYEPPQGETETALAAIWAEILQLDRIGRHDNFFELGGHSLLAVQVVIRVQDVLHAELSIDDIFTYPVLVDLAGVMAKAKPAILPAIQQIDRSGPLPVSFAQQRLWFLAQMEGVSQAYHIPVALRLTGRLEKAMLRRALDRIVVRHEVLRTSFCFSGNEPVQRITPAEAASFSLEEHDLQHSKQAETELEQLFASEIMVPFDLEKGPLIRGRLVQLAEHHHVLLLTMHHIVADGWSVGVFSRELRELYTAYLAGEDDPLAALPVQYADYAVWQRQWIEGDILQAQADYWKTALDGIPALLELPTDYPRPAQQCFDGASAELVLDSELTAALKELSRQHGTTLFMTLLSAWSVLLARLSGQNDIVSGTAFVNRNRVEIEGLIGFFVNTLALRLDLAGSPSVSQLLGEAKSRVLAAQQHQDIPFEQVVELLRPVRSTAHSPIFQVMFDWQAGETAALTLPELQVESFGSHRTAKFDLRLFLEESGDVIRGGIEYATALFRPESIQRFLGHFRTLLVAMVREPEQAVDRLPILDASEREQIIYEWNNTQKDYPSDRCVHQLFEEQVLRSPQAPAVSFEEATLSYDELNRKANQLAHYLRAQGVCPDSRVALCLDRGLEMIVALLAVLKSGGAYVPLDPTYPAERIRFMLEDSRPSLLLTQSHWNHLAAGLSVPVLNLDQESALWSAQPDDNPLPETIGLNSKHLAYIIYTSGSTGTPKGVMIEHRGLCNYLAWALQQYCRIEGIGSPLIQSIAFDGSVPTLFGTLIAGNTLILFQPGSEVEALTKRNLSEPYIFIKLTPSHLKLLNCATMFDSTKAPMQALILGGEILAPPDIACWQNNFPNTRFINQFGPTETTVACTAFEISASTSYGASIPIGRPIANTRIYILDGHGEPVPVGVTGELYIGGAGVARGYFDRSELTAERFLQDPFVDEPGARMYRTGDLGRWLPDGNIEFLGRNDAQVKIRGFRIEPGEIEARLRELPAIQDAVVIAREDTPGDKRLVAYYTAAEETVTASELRAHLSTVLPEYMVPAAYIALAALPITANGKLDRKGLPAPDTAAFSTQAYEPPQGETETALAAIWAEILQLDRIGRQDNFFELGGHSLLAIRVTTHVRQALSAEIAVRDIFTYPVLADLAACLLDRQLEEIDDASLLELLTISSNQEIIPGMSGRDLFEN